MQWVLKLEKIIDGKVASWRTVTRLRLPDTINSTADIGLDTDNAKTILSRAQSLIVTDQFATAAKQLSLCNDCGAKRQLKDYRSRTFDTVFGQVSVKRARFNCPRCGVLPQSKLDRSTPEFDFIRVKLAAHVPFRVARDILNMLTPAKAGTGPSTNRNRVDKVAQQLSNNVEQHPARQSGVVEEASELTLGLDHGYIRSNTPTSSRHHRVLVGNISKNKLLLRGSKLKAVRGTLAYHIDMEGKYGRRGGVKPTCSICLNMGF